MSEIYSVTRNSVPHNDQTFESYMLGYGCTSLNSEQIKLFLSKENLKIQTGTLPNDRENMNR